MSPRRNRPRRDDTTDLDAERARHGVPTVQQWRDGDWQVRGIAGGASAKTYRCPGCDQEIRPGVAHVVAWPADDRGDLTDRRHWHSGCWRARGAARAEPPARPGRPPLRLSDLDHPCFRPGGRRGRRRGRLDR